MESKPPTAAPTEYPPRDKDETKTPEYRAAFAEAFAMVKREYFDKLKKLGIEKKELSEQDMASLMEQAKKKVQRMKEHREEIKLSESAQDALLAREETTIRREAASAMKGSYSIERAIPVAVNDAERAELILEQEKERAKMLKGPADVNDAAAEFLRSLGVEDVKKPKESEEKSFWEKAKDKLTGKG